MTLYWLASLSRYFKLGLDSPWELSNFYLFRFQDEIVAGIEQKIAMWTFLPIGSLSLSPLSFDQCVSGLGFCQFFSSNCGYNFSELYDFCCVIAISEVVLLSTLIISSVLVAYRYTLP